MEKSKIKKVALRTVLLCLISLAFVVVAEVMGVFAVMVMDVPDSSLVFSIVPEFAGALAALVCVMILGGSSCVLTSREDLRTIWRLGWWNIVVTLGLLVFDMGSYISEGQPLVDNWPTLAAELVIFCACIGFFEELMFRGIIFQGILAVSGGTHRGVVRAVLITSLLFGLAHVDFEEASVDFLSFVQAVLKTVQTGMYSFLLCVIVLRSRRLGGVSLYHGLDDLLVILPGVGLFGETFDTDYVSSGDDALPTIMFYLIIIALYLPFVIGAARELRRGNYVTYGLFAERKLASLQDGSVAGVALDGAVVPVPPALSQAPAAAPLGQSPTAAPLGQTSAVVPLGQAPAAAVPEYAMQHSQNLLIPQPLEGVISAPVIQRGETVAQQPMPQEGMQERAAQPAWQGSSPTAAPEALDRSLAPVGQPTVRPAGAPPAPSGFWFSDAS